MDIAGANATWRSSLLKRVGAVKTVVSGPERPGIKQYGAALMMAAAIALGAITPSVGHTAPLSGVSQESSAAFVNSQPEPSNILNRFGQTPSWSKHKSSDKAQRISAFDHLIDSSHSLSNSQKISAVNDFFNQKITYMSDRQAWGQNDYWATPMETLSKGAGDCEDFAIAKYFALQKLGVPSESMKITYVKSTKFTESHMVLLVENGHGEDPVVLDNMMNSVKPLSQRKDLSIVYSFNDKGLFVGRSTQPSAGVERLSRWQDVLGKIGAETQGIAKSKASNPYRLEMVKSEGIHKPSEVRIEIPQEAKATSPRYDRDVPSAPGRG